MSYNHNTEADFAASELARMFVADPALCYSANQLPRGLSASASYEPPSSPWPKADGLITLLETGGQRQRDIAVEYKRQQEGIHGLLTAIGQAQAYLHKGYSGAVLVLPSIYSSLDGLAAYVKEVLDNAGTESGIGVFRYDPPDSTIASPFLNRLHCIRPILVREQRAQIASARPKTQWVHMREGSTTRDAFFRFLQTAKRLSAGNAEVPPQIPQGLRDAVTRIAPGRTAEDYLSNTVDGNKFLNQVWRRFWFDWVATPDVLTPWRKDDNNRYTIPGAFTRILKDDNTGKSQIFEGRSTALKQLIVDQLNREEIDENTGWEQFADGIHRTGRQKTQGVRERAHSYREDLDSSLAQLDWIDAHGHPTDCGYHYMALCERFGGANSQAGIEYVGATLLQTGHYASFLHYVHRLSEEWFSANPLAFSRFRNGQPVFNDISYGEYLMKLEDELSDNLKVMRKVSGRSRPRHRTPFQAELTLLRNYGFVSMKRYRLGVGIPIDWEKVHEAMSIEL